MIKKRTTPTGSKGDEAPFAYAEQGEFWLEPHVRHAHARTPVSSTPQPATTLRQPQSQRSAETKNGHRTLQDLLFAEGLLATRLSMHLDSLEVLQSQLVQHLHQNSLETRTRYAQSILKWFFPDGVGGLAHHVWAAYNDESITADSCGTSTWYQNRSWARVLLRLYIRSQRECLSQRTTLSAS